MLGIAEMGEWMVLRETKANARPFFWNISTEAKSWEAPVILQELGVAEVLQKLSCRDLLWPRRRDMVEVSSFSRFLGNREETICLVGECYAR